MFYRFVTRFILFTSTTITLINVKVVLSFAFSRTKPVNRYCFIMEKHIVPKNLANLKFTRELRRADSFQQIEFCFREYILKTGEGPEKININCPLLYHTGWRSSGVAHIDPVYSSSPGNFHTFLPKFHRNLGMVYK